MDWQNAIAIGAIVIAGITLLLRAFDRSPTIREHDQLKADLENQVANLTTQVRRDDDMLRDKINILEQTRPTTDTLLSIVDGMKDRLSALEKAMLK